MIVRNRGETKMLHPNSDDDTEYDVDGVYKAKELAQEIREIIENWRGEQTDTTIVETILVHLQGAGL
jgi:hypothetical protein